MRALNKWQSVQLARAHWPEAANLRVSPCHCRHKLPMLSFQLAGDKPRGEADETCGYFCASCGFSNAGSRPASLEADEGAEGIG